MLPKIIAICGRKRSGKDTVANHLCKLFGYKNVKISDQLKIVVKQLFNFTDNQVELDEKESIDIRWGVSPRQAMQFFGTEIMQYEIQKLIPNIGRLFWIRSFIERHIKTINENDRFIISDMRFLHEYEELKKYNIFVITIERDHVCDHVCDHASEREYLDIPANLIIHNDGTLEELLIKIDNTLSTE